ncbi:MAG TPA: hypothetical protein ENK72_01885 [Epsilonproteobacteria bacterium]|nr:hypothetical protein [Campylobacterota bacterium]
MQLANSFKEAIFQMMEEIAQLIPDAHKEEPVKGYLTGGAAVHFYANKRVSDDIDLIMQYVVNIPSDLFVVWLNEEGLLEEVHYDHTFNASFGLFQEEYEDRAIHLITIDEKLEIYLLSPEDLIISKLLRFAQNDEEDIENIIKTGKVHRERLLELASGAISVGVGFRPENAHMNLALVLEMFDTLNVDSNSTDNSKVQ